MLTKPQFFAIVVDR